MGFTAMDLNSDQKISYEEFVHFLWHGRIPLKFEKLLLSLPNANATTGEEEPPLIKAIGAADLETVQRLVEVGAADPNMKYGKNSAPALVYCCMQIKSEDDSKLDIVNYLMSRPEVDINATCADGCTAMIWSATFGITSLVEALLTRDDIDLKSS